MIKLLSVLALVSSFGFPALALRGGELLSPDAKVYQSSALIRRLYTQEDGRQVWSHCTATIIGRKHLLSAAHCFTDGESLLRPTKNIAEIYVVFGNSTAEESPASERHAIEGFVLHPDYRGFVSGRYGTQEMNDMAVIKLRDEVPENSVVMGLDQVTQLDFTSTDYSIAGFGRDSTTEKTDGPYFLKGAPARILRFETTGQKGQTVCEQYARHRCRYEVYMAFTSQRRVSIQLEESQYMTKGDSGGPLVVKRGQQMFVTGVASSGSAYELVSPHLAWIRSILSRP